MSIKLVREEIGRFLEGTEPEVLCISGEWGVGKTYSWNYFLEVAQKEKKVGWQHYAYVSLFGMKSLNDLKYSLFEATKPTERIGEKLDSWDDVKTEKRILSTFQRPARVLGNYLSRIPFLQNFIGTTENILFLTVRKQLICIDDLERAGSGLDVMDVFGLVSFLKEQRGCSVVLLLNKEKMDKEQKDIFDKQFEKVVDTHLLFDPNPAEAAGIVFPSPEGIQKQLHQQCITLGIKNIRVIKKIEKISTRLEEILSKKYPELVHQAVHSATLFAWSKYQKDEEPPPFEFLTDVSRVHGLFRDKDKTPESDRKWQTLMVDYKFQSVDDFDFAIHKIVDTGLFDTEALLEAAEKQSQGVAKSKQEQVIHETWELYHGSFDDNEGEVMNAIFKVSSENLKVISPSNLDATVRTLKEFGREKEAAELLEKYMEERKDEKELFDLKRSAFGSDIRDPDVLKAFEKKITEFVDNRDPADVLEGMITNRGWNPEDVELIDTLSPDDFYKIFKKEQGNRLHRVVRAAFQLGARDETEMTKKHGSIPERATKALKIIAGETKLNAKRVATQGIKLDE